MQGARLSVALEHLKPSPFDHPCQFFHGRLHFPEQLEAALDLVQLVRCDAIERLFVTLQPAVYPAQMLAELRLSAPSAARWACAEA
jgi:hypothetical protein